MTQMKVEHIDHMGNDDSVVNAARVSFAKQADQYTGDQNARLIKYLARHNHWTPFAHAFVTLRFKAPIAIHAQCVKHQIGFAMNTVSRRYVSDEPELFIPEFRLAPEGSVKQGSGEVFDVMYYACDGSTSIPKIDFMSSDKAEVQDFIKASDKELFLTSKDRDDLSIAYKHYAYAAIETYNNLIRLGVAPEQARFVLPQGVMTEWVWSGSLQAWARFYNQRSDSHAQQEIQYLAHEVDKIVGALFPVSWEALTGSTVEEPTTRRMATLTVPHYNS